MSASLKFNERPDVSAQGRAANELVKRIRKLRWIGMEEEARALQRQASFISSSTPVLAEPADTD